MLFETPDNDPIAELRPLVAGLERGVAVDVGFGDGESLELMRPPMTEVSDSSVQLVLVINALQYFDLPALAATVGRVLRPGGHLVGCVPKPGYYMHPRHLLEIRLGERPWWLISYPRSALRSAIFSATGRLPRLGGSTPEVGWTQRTLERFAALAGLEIVQDRPAPANRRAISLRRA